MRQKSNIRERSGICPHRTDCKHHLTASCQWLLHHEHCIHLQEGELPDHLKKSKQQKK